MTSCIDSPRSADALDSPSTQRTASMTFDLPQSLGPTRPSPDDVIDLHRRRKAAFLDRMAGDFTGAQRRVRHGLQHWNLTPATLGGERTARVKRAAGRRLERIRHFAGDRGPWLAGLGQI